MPDSQEIAQKLDALQRLFRDRLERDDVQQRAFDQLYDELRQYKEDFIYPGREAVPPGSPPVL